MKVKNSQGDKLKLNDAEVLRRAQTLLEKHLPLAAEGYAVSRETLYQVLLGVVANQSTLETVCAELADAPTGEAVRGYINEQIKVEDLTRLEQQLNAALIAHQPDCGVEVATLRSLTRRNRIRCGDWKKLKIGN